ncbi:MAG: Flagellar hook-associated protein 1, partial [Pseudomonadota bacterium]
MSDLLSIGSSGVTAYQRALATVSNNIANVNTEGYSRQDIKIASNEPRLLGGSYIGTGVRFDAVKRQYDEFIESNLRNSTSELKSQEPLLSYVNRVIDIMGDANIGLTSALNQFFQSARDLSSDPASTVQRNIFLRDSDGLASRFRQLSSQLETLSRETQQAVDTTLGQVNSITNQLAQLNKQMSKQSSVSKQPSELLDQRDLLLRNLSGLISVQTKFSDNGTVLVSVGDTISQGVLVREDTARAITVNVSNSDPNKLEFMIDPYGTPEGLPNISSGNLGGILNFRETVLNPALNSLNDLATTTVREVNAIHRDGIDSEGKIGGDLFKYTAGLDKTAAGVQLAIQDASRIAAAGQFRIIDDPLNPGNGQARISYLAPTYQGPEGLKGDLGTAIAPFTASLSLPVSSDFGFTQVGVLKAGTKDAVITLNAPQSDREFQVLTRDGKHLLGNTLSPIEISRMVKNSNGMESGAQYDSRSLNLSASASYLDMDLFLGAKAQAQSLLQFNAEGEQQDSVKSGAVLTSNKAPANFLAAIQKNNVFTLNGVTLTPPVAPATPFTSADLVNWLNSFTAVPNQPDQSTGVVAKLITEKITTFRQPGFLNANRAPSGIDAAFNLPNRLTINGVTLTPPALKTPPGVAFSNTSTPQDLVNWMNSYTVVKEDPRMSTGVVASLVDGKLKLSLGPG